ncbi:MAG: esterase/lipase family protein [Phycisphaerales bacterium JB059]
MRKRVILGTLTALVLGAGVGVGIWTFTSRGDADAAATRVSAWHGLRVLEGDAWARPGASLPEHIVLLVHGLDEPGSIWDQLAPALRDAGYTPVRFDYPNDQAVADSAQRLDAALRRLDALGVGRVSIVAHSMGGLVSRDALTRPSLLERADPPRAPVDRLITLGTPHAGSPWAGWRWAAELREQAERLMGEPLLEAEDLYRFSFDGEGEAGADLRPGSPFLTDLNARPNPENVAITCIVGTLITPPPGASAELNRLALTLGDGVVPVPSAQLEGCDDIVFLRANHRGMVRSLPFNSGNAAPPAIRVVLDRLGSVAP